MRKIYILILFTLFTTLFYTKAFSQAEKLLENKEYRNNFVSFASINKEHTTQLATLKAPLIKELTGNNNDITYLKSTNIISLKNGKEIQREEYQLYKDGVRIRGGQYIINLVSDSSGFVQGFFAPIANENFEKGFDAKVCAKLALEYFNHSHQIKDTANASSGVTDSSIAIYYFDYVREEYRPAYQVTITSKNTAYSENLFISASTGEFMGSENLVCTINFPGTAQTQYSGTRNIVTDAPTAAGPFRLQETRGANNVLIRTRNMNHRQDLSWVTDFTDNDNNWIVAEHGVNRAAFDAHWGAETVFDYWWNVHNRNSINGSEMAVESYVHWDVPDDPNDFNARWYQNSVRYGDGIGGTNPLTSLDICAHELGHGIDQYTGDLLYERESGALDEGFADIWGTCVEAWAKPLFEQFI